MSKRSRLFIALWPSDALRDDIERETNQAVAQCGGRLIPAKNFHITLAFLGLVPEARVEDVRQCMSITLVEPFELILGAINWWPQHALLCLEPTAGAEALLELVSRLQTSLCAKGFAIEPRPFRAHLTLAYEVLREPACKTINQLHWQVQRMELVESHILSTGSVYTILPT